MSHLETIRAHERDPEQLELSYQQAVQAGETEAFAAAIDAGFREDSDNLLYAAWHFRLIQAAKEAGSRVIAWGWAIPLAVLNGLILWLLSDDQRFTIQVWNALRGREQDFLPAVALLALPISAAVLALFLLAAGKKRWQPALLAILGLAAASAYVLLTYRQAGPRVFQQQYLSLMVMNLGLLAWAGIGLVGLRGNSDPANRFAFLIKSLEVIIMAGLFVVAGGIFTGVTFSLFQVMGVEPPNLIVRLFLAGGGGLLAVLAVAIIYDPLTPPARQSFDEGLSKLIVLLMRLLLPLSVLVLLVYLAFIPFNFREPFENRDALITFNAMLFAVIALLVGVTPTAGAKIDSRVQTWLRRGVIALAALALLVSLYALAAILYRTVIDRLTPNRLAFIGWNIINIGILVWLLIQQSRAGRKDWLPAFHATFAAGMRPYIIWSLVVLLLAPWMFSINQGEVSTLPPRIQNLVYEQPYPILLKCTGPHIYLLEKGEKRWIKDIPTFEARGFDWRDVEFVACDDLRSIPDGPPIPKDAGPPPEP